MRTWDALSLCSLGRRPARSRLADRRPAPGRGWTFAADGSGGVWLWAPPPRGAWTEAASLTRAPRAGSVSAARDARREDRAPAEARLTRTEGT